jgi:hypothetical protein
VLDDVERRRFLVEPAGEHPAPLAVGPLDVELDERAGERLRLPRRGGFARAQPHDDVLPPHRLAGTKRDVLDDAVALVEDAKNGDALRHGCHAGLVDARRHTRVATGLRAIALVAAAAGGKGEREDGCSGKTHVYSGIQGS